MQLFKILVSLALPIVLGLGPAFADQDTAPVIENATPVQATIAALGKLRVAQAQAGPRPSAQPATPSFRSRSTFRRSATIRSF